MSRTLALTLLLAAATVTDAQTKPAGQPARSGQAGPTGQPAAAQNQAPPFPERILEEWYRQTSQIKTLQGEHRRWVYDPIFGIEKRSKGVFYYVAPDKGRIDFVTWPAEKGEVSQKKTPEGRAYVIKPDKPERYICDGTDIRHVNDAEKTVDVHPIPENGRGHNIMNGPLPFLFGMPPKTARSRYVLRLLKETETEVWIAALPKWRQDQANWREAKIILRKPMYLPIAVQMADPGGNKETVYTFAKLEANGDPTKAKTILPWVTKDVNPFRPTDIKDYPHTVKSTTNSLQTADASTNKRLVPSVINFRYDQATAHLKRAGYRVQVKAGRAIEQANLQGMVYEQHPPAKTALPPGNLVVLTAYGKPTGTAKPAPAATAPGTIPNVTKLPWDKAEAALKAAGYAVKKHQGPAAPQKEMVYAVSAQSPQAGEKLAAGQVVHIQIYTPAKQ